MVATIVPLTGLLYGIIVYNHDDYDYQSTANGYCYGYVIAMAMTALLGLIPLAKANA